LDNDFSWEKSAKIMNTYATIMENMGKPMGKNGKMMGKTKWPQTTTQANDNSIVFHSINHIGETTLIELTPVLRYSQKKMPNAF
jgi:hypothetical protein